jgi:hypothetical protein
MHAARSCGALHAVLLLGDGAAWSLGMSSRGGLGQGEGVCESSTPAPMRLLIQLGVHAEQAETTAAAAVVAVAAGGGHTLLVDAAGRAYSCGDNRFGQLGLGHRQPRWVPTPVDVPTIPEGVPSAVPALHVSEPELHAELEPGPRAEPEPELPPESTQLVKHVECGDYHTLLVTAGNTLFSCGQGRCGQLGHSADCLDDCLQPRPVDLPCGRIVATAAGGGERCAHTLVLLDIGRGTAGTGRCQKLLGFGSGSSGQLGPAGSDYVRVNDAPCPPFTSHGASIGPATATESSSAAKAVEVPIEQLGPGGHVLGLAAGWLHSACLYTISEGALAEAAEGGTAGEAATDACCPATACGPWELLPNGEIGELRGPWELLPNEVILRVLAHCAAAELCQLARTASLLRDLSGSDRLWCRLFRAQFAAASPPVIGDGEPHREAEGENAEAPAGWKRRYAQETLAYLKRRERLWHRGALRGRRTPRQRAEPEPASSAGPAQG